MQKLPILGFLIMLLGCGTAEVPDITYIKVLDIEYADSANAYNKGYTTASYAYYNPATDSFIHQYHYDGTKAYKTFVGNLRNSSIKDSFLNAVQVLRRYAHGTLPFQQPEGSVYCGPVLSLEFKDRNGLHNYIFLMGINDTLDQFCRVYESLHEQRWNRQLASNTIVDRDSEVVAFYKNAGEYHKIPIPYILSPCPREIDFSRLYGEWRFVQWPPESRGGDWRFILRPDGMSQSEKIKDGKIIKLLKGRFALNRKDSTITFFDKSGDNTYNITRLTSDCLQYENREVIIRLDRWRRMEPR
jgi:hypothetical protein